MPTLQKEINSKKKGQCGFENGTLKPCGYHRNRTDNTIYAIKENILKKENDFQTGVIPASAQFKEFGKKFLTDEHQPAGGWYLVKEQRDWLKDTLFQVINGKNFDGTVHILEAGVAGYAHHFSYLMILKDLQALLNQDLKLEITAVDKCIFPLSAIEAINKGVIQEVKGQPVLDLSNYTLVLNRDNLDAIEKNNLTGCDHLSVTIKEVDLTLEEEVSRLGTFDIITEHFLTAVIENFDLIKRIRKIYAKILTPDGHLLCACGISRGRNKSEYLNFLDTHVQNGLELVHEKLVWDPYGMSRENILNLMDNKDVNTFFDNSMMLFRKRA